jgi:hypothetical protein
MHPNFFEIFFLSFLAVAAGYGLVAGWTKLFYRNKAVGQLTGHELRIKQGTASIEQRLAVFSRAFFGALFTYQVYLLALCCAGIAFLLLRFVAD